MPVGASGSKGLFSNTFGADKIQELSDKTIAAEAELESLITNFKSEFSFGTIAISDSGYQQNIVQLKGVSADLGAHALDTAVRSGLREIIWVVVVLGCLGILFVGRF